MRFHGKLHRRKLETNELEVAERKLRTFKDDLERTDATKGNASFASVLDAYDAALCDWMPPCLHSFYEIRPRNDRCGVDLISDALPFGRLWYGDANAVAIAIAYAEHYSRSHDAVIRVYDGAGNVIETHEHKGDFKE